MKLQVITLQYLPAICSILALFLIDSFAYYVAYILTENRLPGNAGILFPWFAYFIMFLIFYLFKRYNPSPRISMG